MILAIAIATALLPFQQGKQHPQIATEVAAKAATTAVPTAHCHIACDRAQLYWGCDRLDLRSAVRLGLRGQRYLQESLAHSIDRTIRGFVMIDSVEKTTIRKIYVRLLPLLFVAYFICYSTASTSALPR